MVRHTKERSDTAPRVTAAEAGAWRATMLDSTYQATKVSLSSVCFINH